MASVPLHRKVATKVYSRDQWQIVKLYDAEIVKFTEEAIRLDSGGYRTVTTKRRMNQAAQRFMLPFTVYQSNNVWWIKIRGEAEPIPFYDGITISRDRSQPHPDEQNEIKAEQAAEEERYNGWANRATWNVFLWLNNDYDLYNRFRTQRRERGPFTPKSAYSWCLRIWRNGKTPDGDLLSAANWIDLAAAMNEE